MMDWKPALEVGVDEMDSDHRILIDLLNRIHEASERSDRDLALNVLDELQRYTEWHFAREEALMQYHGYEFASEHRNEHRKLALQVRDYVEDLEAGSVGVHDIAAFMQRWLLAHIAGSDRHLGQAISEARRRSERP